MSSNVFDVTISGGRHNAHYAIRADRHDGAAVAAAIEALRTFERHGHAKFPYEGGDLTVSVSEREGSTR